MIKLSLEIPTSALKTITPMTDFDFVLAHKVLADQAYAHFFAKRHRNRMLILDNSMHELGAPLPVKDLKRAAAMCRANVVVAPDQLGEPEKNLKWFDETYEALHCEHRVAVTITGRDYKDRLKYVLHIKHRTEMVCFPFRENRLHWWQELKNDILPWCPSVHLFGVSELAELTQWAEIANANPDTYFSVDTTKPVKFGLREQLITDLPTLRSSAYDKETGGNTHAKELLDVETVSASQMKFIISNVQELRRVCSGG